MTAQRGESEKEKLARLVAQRDALQVEIRSLRRKIEVKERQRSANIESHIRETPIKWHEEWTGPELEVIAREDLTARQAAEMLGRTFWAVKGMRRKLLVSPREQRMANLGPGYQA